MLEEIDRFLLTIEAQRNYSDHTVRAYRNDLEIFAGFFQQKNLPFPEGLDRFLVRDYLSFLTENNYSKNSILRKISTVRSFTDWLLSNRIITQNPFDLVSMPKGSPPAPVS